MIQIDSLTVKETLSSINTLYLEGGKEAKEQFKYKRLLLERLGSGAKGLAAEQPYAFNLVFGNEGTIKELSLADDTQEYNVDRNVTVASVAPIYMQLGATFAEVGDLSRHGFRIDKSGSSIGIRQLAEGAQNQLIDYFGEKMKGLRDTWDEEQNLRLWNDGSRYPDSFAGIMSLITEDVTTSLSVMGVDQATQPLWRNVINLGINVSTPANKNIQKAFQKVFRDATKYGTPSYTIVAGGDFIDAIFDEQITNHQADGTNGMSQVMDGEAAVRIRVPGLGMVEIVRDHALDELGKAKYCYGIDMNSIQMLELEGRGFRDPAEFEWDAGHKRLAM